MHSPVYGRAGEPRFFGAMMFACPPSGRPWLAALLGELAVIDGTRPRAVWFLGALRLVLALHWDRAVAFIASPFTIAGAVLAAAATICAILFAVGGEGLLTEDDSLLLLALLFGLTSVGGRGISLGQPNSSPRGPHLRFGLGALAVLLLVGGAIVGLSSAASAGRGGVLDDGKQHLSSAGISLDEAIASAQSAAAGPVDEVDLEYWQGKLVFNIDVGSKDVKVDAETGAVLSASSRD
jgi:hypothetical protein